MSAALHPRQFPFVFGCLIESSLLLIALPVAWLTQRPFCSDLSWSIPAAAYGVLATLPLLILFYFLLHSPVPAWKRIRQFLDLHLRPLMQSWPIWQLAVLSITAGFCEEVLFRDILQGGLSPWLGTTGALLAASLLFGICHFITPGYALLATLIGIYLGGLWIASGNLFAPVVTHALYDFLALVYYLRVHRTSNSEHPRSA